MTTQRFIRPQVLADLTATPRPIRPSTECASSSQCQRSKDHKARRRIEILIAGHSAFFTPSAFALGETDKSHRKDKQRSAAPPISLDARQDRDLGGARRDRTDDLMLAKHALSQLSYGPVSRPAGARRPVVVGLGGLEPPTSRLSSARSNQLSYKPGRKKKSAPAQAVNADRDARLPYP